MAKWRRRRSHSATGVNRPAPGIATPGCKALPYVKYMLLGTLGGEGRPLESPKRR
jgi:hypothetical protein